MKKLLIFLSMITFIDKTFAQTKNYYLNPVTIDNEVKVSLPKEFAKNAANGQQSYAANGQYGTFFVIASANPANAKVVKNTNGLDNVFEEYIKKVKSNSGKGIIVDDHDISVGKLAMREFTLQVDSGNGVQNRHFRLLYTKATTYTFEYMYDDVIKEQAVGEMNAFLASIKTAPDLDRDDQYVVTSQTDHSVVTKIIWFGLVPLILIIGAVVFFRRRDTMTLT